MEFLWDFYRMSMEFLCDFYGLFMVLLLDFYGISVVFYFCFCVRDSYGSPMGFLWDIFAISIV
jgi:hypothetical protein